MRYFSIFLFLTYCLNSQNINVNNEFNYSLIRSQILSGELNSDYSLNIKPLNFSNGFNNLLKDEYKVLVNNEKNNFEIKFLGIDYFIEYNTSHPYNRNNGSMIPNKGYQHIISPGIFLRFGPLTIQFQPEHHYSGNKSFNGFWDGHYPEIWAKRYRLWNHIDMPEKFGKKT